MWAMDSSAGVALENPICKPYRWHIKKGPNFKLSKPTGSYEQIDGWMSRGKRDRQISFYVGITEQVFAHGHLRAQSSHELVAGPSGGNRISNGEASGSPEL
ncbi:hypothetical protein EVAR_78947_1 [Eumeta japonica]|uniref:Uncharacterized protein n=1 Tax=Eumeta variegata TaxID=151549 RepID=A0A4C1U2T7_EUMVA|nr:hypothetical protein EVAR_78947_1 [Eumeta japonica]